MLISEVRLQNFLSFGPEGVSCPLRSLNVLIGPNGSGKSNFMDAFQLLRAAPIDITAPIRRYGSTPDWLWKGPKPGNVAKLDFTIDNAIIKPGTEASRLAYSFSFSVDEAKKFKIVAESVKKAQDAALTGHNDILYEYVGDGYPRVMIKKSERDATLGEVHFVNGEISFEASILSQLRGPDFFPEITYLARNFQGITLYGDWKFGRGSAPRLPQSVDRHDQVLRSDASNLGLVLIRLGREPGIKERLESELSRLYPGFVGYDINHREDTIQLVFKEGQNEIPATRLSDGTIRYLSLLCVLLDPTPPPLVCLEEPELGLHPDILPGLARLLLEASERTQLIVGTHSAVLVNALHNNPESIIVCERDDNEGTRMERLDPDELKPWLEKYRLADLWDKGIIGGVRW